MAWKLAHLTGKHLQVDRNLDEDRPGLAGVGDFPGLEKHRRYLRVAGNEKGGLGQWPEESMLIEFMKLVALVEIATDAAADDQHRDAVEKGFADAAGGVGDPGRRNDHQGAGLFRGSADPIGHERRPAFMSYEHRRDLPGTVEFVVQFSVVHPGDAEGVSDAERFEGSYRDPGAGPFHDECSRSSASGCRGQRLWQGMAAKRRKTLYAFPASPALSAPRPGFDGMLIGGQKPPCFRFDPGTSNTSTGLREACLGVQELCGNLRAPSVKVPHAPGLSSCLPAGCRREDRGRAGGLLAAYAAAVPARSHQPLVAA